MESSRIRHQRINNSNSYGRYSLFCGGVFKLGAVIKFIPYPIIVGFTSGIAHLPSSQIADIFGLVSEEKKYRETSWVNG